MLIKGNNSFAWGSKPDLHVTLNEDIVLDNVVPEPVNSRGHLGLKKKDLQTVLQRMVVVFNPHFMQISIGTTFFINGFHQDFLGFFLNFSIFVYKF